MTCTQCSTSKAKRSCPALDTTICTKCCAAGREADVACPLTCEYLLTAHQFERKVADKTKTPSQDIPTDKAFLSRNEDIIVLIGASLLHATHLQADVDDHDLLAVLSSLVATWREMTPRVMKEPYVCDRAVTMIADRVNADIGAFFQNASMKARQLGNSGSAPMPQDILGSLCFLQRICYASNNGKPKCRAFLLMLKKATPYEKTKKDEPLVVLA